jgi:hypothetical protein
MRPSGAIAIAVGRETPGICVSVNPAGSVAALVEEIHVNRHVVSKSIRDIEKQG